jgi:hypothetical protein
MKIKVFTTINESWDSGDLNSTKKKYFISEELRNDYFKNVLREYYKSFNDLEEYEPDHFCEKMPSRQHWSYYIGKDEEELEIFENKYW